MEISSMLNNSFGCETINLYKRIDTKVDTHFKGKKKQAPCAKGCASCCSQFFEISEVEYIIILNHLKEWNKVKLDNLIEIADIYSQVLEKHHNKFYKKYFSEDAAAEEFSGDHYYRDSERYKIHIPCVFLSEEGACTIYQVRPLICRTTGVGFKHNFEFGNVCREIRSIFWSRRWQADLREFQNDILSVNWLEWNTSMDASNYQAIERRQYPIFHHIKESFAKGSPGFSDSRLNDYFNMSKENLVEKLIANSNK